MTPRCCCCCCCCLHIINHPGLSLQYLLLSQSLCTTPTLDSADFRGHRLTYLEKVYENKMDPRGSAEGDKLQSNKKNVHLKTTGRLRVLSQSRTIYNDVCVQRGKTVIWARKFLDFYLCTDYTLVQVCVWDKLYVKQGQQARPFPRNHPPLSPLTLQPCDPVSYTHLTLPTIYSV